MARKFSKVDSIFRFLVLAVASAIVVLTVIYFYVLIKDSAVTLRTGLAFITGSTWNEEKGIFEVLPELYGSVVTSAIALLLGVPVSIGVAIFLSEQCPRRLRFPISFLVEMLAAVPSVVYGLWGLIVLSPLLEYKVYPVAQSYLGFLPIFRGRIFGLNFMTAGIVLAIMMIPIVASISKDALMAVPDSQREASYALGATRSEAVRMSVLKYARPGIIASVFIGFGRAFGETMAVTMLIGGAPDIPKSLFYPGQTLASLIATSYADALTPAYRSAVIEAGLVLLLVSFLANVAARTWIVRVTKGREAASFA